MLGGIAGDIIGSRFEHAGIKSKEFELFNRQSVFTDDTVHTVALADSLLHNIPYQEKLREYFHYYPNAGYGGRFRRWACSPKPTPYGSYGNGSAMRVSPVAWFYEDLDTVLNEARHSAEITHNHPEGIKGAQAVAAAVFMARTSSRKDKMKSYIEEHFSYDLSSSINAIRENYGFEVSCQASVPQAIVAFPALVFGPPNRTGKSTPVSSMNSRISSSLPYSSATVLAQANWPLATSLSRLSMLCLQ